MSKIGKITVNSMPATGSGMARRSGFKSEIDPIDVYRRRVPLPRHRQIDPRPLGEGRKNPGADIDGRGQWHKKGQAMAPVRARRRPGCYPSQEGVKCSAHAHMTSRRLSSRSDLK